jgi:hypothetical protein
MSIAFLSSLSLLFAIRHPEAWSDDPLLDLQEGSCDET